MQISRSSKQNGVNHSLGNLSLFPKFLFKRAKLFASEARNQLEVMVGFALVERWEFKIMCSKVFDRPGPNTTSLDMTGGVNESKC